MSDKDQIIKELKSQLRKAKEINVKLYSVANDTLDKLKLAQQNENDKSSNAGNTGTDLQ